MLKFISFFFAILIFSSFAYPMHKVHFRNGQSLGKMHDRFKCINYIQIRVICTSGKPISALINSICWNDTKESPLKYFNINLNTKDVLKIMKEELYKSQNWPHVDPTPGNQGYCQLIAGFLGHQLIELNKIDVENCEEEETRLLLPLVKAFILQEYHNPSEYQALSVKSVKQRLVDLKLIDKELLNSEKFSNQKADRLLKRTQKLFMEDLFCFTKTTESSNIKDSMKVAIDNIYESDCFIHTRYYEGTPSRPDIFSSVGTPVSGNLYRRSALESEKWEKMSSLEQAKLLIEDDRTNIIQIHFEHQPMLNGWFREFGLDQKPEVRKILDRNKQLKHINGINDFFGFGDSIFDLREFVMRGVEAINDPKIEFCDPLHPITTPCHFSVVPGMKNLAKLLALSSFYDELNQRYDLSRKPSYRGDFSYAPLLIRRYISHCKNTSPDNPITWVLQKRFRGIDLQLGLAYDEKNKAIDPEYSFLFISEGIGRKSMPVRDRKRALEIYDELIDEFVRNLIKPGYLYPQARFLLKQAKISKETIDDLLKEEFKSKLVRNFNE